MTIYRIRKTAKLWIVEVRNSVIGAGIFYSNPMRFLSRVAAVRYVEQQNGIPE